MGHDTLFKGPVRAKKTLVLLDGQFLETPFNPQLQCWDSKWSRIGGAKKTLVRVKRKSARERVQH